MERRDKPKQNKRQNEKPMRKCKQIFEMYKNR